MWNIDQERNQFKRDYKHLSSDLQKKSIEAIRDLAAIHDPRKLGEHKTGPLSCLHTYDIGRQYRILYDVVNEEHTLVLPCRNYTKSTKRPTDFSKSKQLQK